MTSSTPSSASPAQASPTVRVEPLASRLFSRPAHPTCTGAFIFARLKPGVTLHQAQAELSTLQAHVPRQPGRPPLTLQVDPLRNDWLSASLQRNLWLLLAAVGFVLLIACANLANLLLARGASRQRELAVRSALGATSRQIFTQLLTESFALVIAGGALGCLLGWGLLHLILAVLPEVGKSNAEAVVEINLPVLLFGLSASLLAGRDAHHHAPPGRPRQLPLLAPGAPRSTQRPTHCRHGSRLPGFLLRL